MEGQLSVDTSAIKNMCMALIDLAQTMTVVNGNLNSLLTELKQEVIFNDALQTVNHQVKIILQIIAEIRLQVARLDEDRGSNMKFNEQPQTPYNLRWPSDFINKGPRSSVPPNFSKTLATASLNIRQRLHELAQPLVVVTGTIDLLLMEIEHESKHYQRLQTISEHLEHIVIIIDEVRNMAREVGEAFIDYNSKV